MHPGDVRVLKAVDRPELRNQHCNVVVFSSKGDRPEQNKLSCGDLDGDSYLIIWEEDIMKHMNPEKMYEPNSFKDPPAERIKEK